MPAGHFIRTPEFRAKMSLAKKGFKHTEEWKKANSERMQGHLVSEETRRKISLAQKGIPRKKHTEETKQRMREIALAKGFGKWMKGKELSQKTKDKISQNSPKIWLGKKFSADHIRKVLTNRSMSSLEIKIQGVIDEFHLPYRFVGNGEFFIENKNPDFVHLNDKIVVEAYWVRHKEHFREGGVEGWMSERLSVFTRNGYKVIFIEATGINKPKILESLV